MKQANSQCRTILLEDSPAENDAFGPHQRVADAIVELVSSPEELGGKAIGLEGGWGSGKSTVVKFVRNSLTDNSSFLVVPFDAWAHEGDPLRRSYLETIIRTLQSNDWLLDQLKWNKILQGLAKRRKETSTRITPKPTPLGVALAISILLVPIGTTLLAAVLRTGVEQAYSSPTIAGIVGAICLIAPFLVLACNLVRIICRSIWRTFYKWVCLPFYSYFGKPVHDPKARKNEVKEEAPPSNWSFLFSKAIQETYTDTIESSNPTSIEFEDFFTEAMSDSLGSDSSRRILLVVDNLDRVEPEDALAIWSTLQTFLQERSGNTEAWFTQIWILAPYDPAGLRKLWGSRYADDISDSGDANVSESFLDKSFQIRFRVPPPVLSDWKAYLYSLIEEALPSHADDQHILYRIYENERNTHRLLPTPREIKLYVNQIGAIHRQWQHEFPLGHVAYYVLQNRKHMSLIDKLRGENFPSTDAVRLLGEELTQSLAGLSFNTQADKGMELLLSDGVLDCLRSKDSSRLKDLNERHREGFWAVLESVAYTKLYDSDPASIAAAANCLLGAAILEDTRPEAKSVLDGLRKAGQAIEKWDPFDEGMAEGIAALCELQNSDTFSEQVGKSVQATAQAGGKDKETVAVEQLASALMIVFDKLENLKHDSAIPATTVLPVDVDEWVTVCDTFCKTPSTSTHWNRIRPKVKFDDVSTAIQGAVGNGEFDQHSISTIRVTDACSMKSDWSAVVSAIDARLRAEIGAEHDEMHLLLEGLWHLRRQGAKGVESSIKTLVEGGHIMHHLQQANASGNSEGKALCILTQIRQAPDLTAPPGVGNSAAGHQQYIGLLESSDEELAVQLVDLLDEHDELGSIFDIIDSRKECDNLIGSCLKVVAESTAPARLFSNAVIAKRWQNIRDALTTDEEDNVFDALLGRLADEDNLCQSILDSEGGFLPDNSELYWRILTSKENDTPEFLDWCKSGIEGLVKSAWISDLSRTSECVWLALNLADKNRPPTLTTPFADAIEEHIESVVKGQHIPEEAVVGRWGDVLDLVDGSVRSSLQPRVLAIAIAADGAIDDAFFQMYGEEIGVAATLAANDSTVSRLFSPIVRARSVRGLKWLLNIFEQAPALVEVSSSDDKVQEFVTRIRDCISNPQEDDAQNLINQLADKLAIEITIEELESDGSEDDASPSEG